MQTLSAALSAAIFFAHMRRTEAISTIHMTHLDGDRIFLRDIQLSGSIPIVTCNLRLGCPGSLPSLSQASLHMIYTG